MDIFRSDSDWDSSSDSGSSDIGELDFLYGGQACKILTSMDEVIGKIDDLLLFERGFIRGEIVSSMADRSGQMGRIVNITMSVDLESIHGKAIQDVDSKKLLKIRSISAGDYVIHGPWIGRVDKVVDNVTVLLDDGTKCEIIAMDPEKILPISSNLLEDSAYPYYPGQRVKVKLSTDSKSANWLCGGYGKKNHDTGTVSAVKAGLLYVDWLACAIVGSDSSIPGPQCLQVAESLTLLSCFSHENWQLGDWCMLNDIEVDKIGRGLQKRRANSSFPEVFAIVKTKRMVDVMWQDGTCSLGVNSQSLQPVNVVNAHEFWPGQFVLEKSTSDDIHTFGDQNWGVVISVDSKERTVDVEWRRVGSDQIKETVSAYELVEHPDYSFCYGDLVIKNGENGMAGECRDNGFGRDQRACASDYYLSIIGYVAGFKDGGVEVTWASGLNTKVAPNDIFRIDMCEASTAALPPDEQNVDVLNQGPTDQDKQSASFQGQEPLNSSSFSIPQSTFGFLSKIAASIFKSFGSPSLSGSKPSFVSQEGSDSKTAEANGKMEMCDFNEELEPLVASQVQSFEETMIWQEQNVDQEHMEDHSVSPGKSPEQFKRFDMVSDYSDHHFLDGAGKGLALSQVKRGWLKVQREWSILEKDLPESIYIRVYEERMDLLRAVIIGAEGTPYHDGLFFFDIYLPPEYPHEPPVLHYRSGGLRINPNLYESGKVCLSLLNTWTGTGTEVWNPETSTILQVLLSLQALVLNEKPYFNEAGYDKQIGRAEGEKNSLSYNENAFLMTWKSMLYILRQPPKHFEALVEEHLRRRSYSILSSCKAYMEGAEHDYSKGFKIMLAKLFPKLVEAFFDKGINCSQFVVPGN